MLDLKRDEDLSVLKKLLGRADVLVQNLAPGASKRLGLDSYGDIADRTFLFLHRSHACAIRGRPVLPSWMILVGGIGTSSSMIFRCPSFGIFVATTVEPLPKDTLHGTCRACVYGMLGRLGHCTIW